MRAHQHGVAMGLLYTLPVAAWAIAQTVPEWRLQGGVHTHMQVAIQILWFAQIVATSLLLSGILARYSLGEQFMGAMAAMLLPLPMLPLAWLAGAASGTALVHGQLVVVAFCLVTLLALNGVGRLPIAGRLRALSHVGVQMLGVAFVWRYRESWLGWIGL